MTETLEEADGDQLMTYRQLAEKLACSVSGARAIVKSGEIPLVKLGEKTHRVRLGDVRKYIKRGGTRANV